MDFPDDNETLFLGRLPRISESEYFQDLGLEQFQEASKKVNLEDVDDDTESNDSAVYSEDLRSEGEVSSSTELDNILPDDEDSYLCSAVAFGEVCRQQDSNKVIKDNTSDALNNETDLATDEDFEDVVVPIPTFEDIIAEDTGGGVLDPEDDIIDHFATAQNITDTDDLLSGSNLVPDLSFESSHHNLFPLPEDSEDLSNQLPISFENILYESESSDVPPTTHDGTDVFGNIDTLLQEDIACPTKNTGEQRKLSFENTAQFEAELNENFKITENLNDELDSIDSKDNFALDFNLAAALTPDEDSSFHLDPSGNINLDNINNVTDLLSSIIGANANDDLLNSILETEGINSDFGFNSNDEFDINSVDPTCVSDLIDVAQIKQEKVDPDEIPQLVVNIKKEPVELPPPQECWALREHDYSLPMPSSLFLTPPHSPGDDSEEDSLKKSLLKKHSAVSRSRNQIVKFNKPKDDLKFTVTLPVKGGNSSSRSRVNARSILKTKFLQSDKAASLKSNSLNSQNKSACELVKEILQKKNLANKHLQEKREFVKNMRKRMREESLKEQEVAGSKSKFICLEDNKNKVDKNKYRKFEEERELHNHMERERRIEMKRAYDCLKEVIPSIANTEKVSKLNILNQARDYYQSLESKIERLQSCKKHELDRRRMLQQRLELLQLQTL